MFPDGVVRIVDFEGWVLVLFAASLFGFRDSDSGFSFLGLQASI